MSLLDDLTPKQRMFVELYTGPIRGNAIKCAKEAGYGAGMSSELMRNEKILSAIEEQNELKRRQMFYDEQDILEKLWEEAQKEGRGSSQNGRIQALVYLGKHIGMWDDKSKALAEAKENQGKGGVTYNIINFSDSEQQSLKNKVVEAIDHNLEAVEKELKHPKKAPGIIIENYGDSDRD